MVHNKAIEGDAPETGDSPIKTVLRSKGFMWVANSHTTAYYWSHAGQYFEIRDEGEWWVAVPDDMWPDVQAQVRRGMLAAAGAVGGGGAGVLHCEVGQVSSAHVFTCRQRRAQCAPIVAGVCARGWARG